MRNISTAWTPKRVKTFAIALLMLLLRISMLPRARHAKRENLNWFFNGSTKTHRDVIEVSEFDKVALSDNSTIPQKAVLCGHLFYPRPNRAQLDTKVRDNFDFSENVPEFLNTQGFLRRMAFSASQAEGQKHRNACLQADCRLIQPKLRPGLHATWLSHYLIKVPKILKNQLAPTNTIIGSIAVKIINCPTSPWPPPLAAR